MAELTAVVSHPRQDLTKCHQRWRGSVRVSLLNIKGYGKQYIPAASEQLAKVLVQK